MKEEQLTTDGAFKRDVVFWPDGKELIYAQLTSKDSQGQGRTRLMRLKLADHEVSLFHPQNRGWCERELAVIPDASVYAFVHAHLSNLTITVKHLKLGKTVSLSNPYWIGRPTLTPDGNTLAYVEASHQMKLLPLWKEGAKAADLARIRDLGPNFSPDGRRIVFTSSRDGNYEIYVMAADGSNQQRLTRSSCLNMNAVFSPDGKQIAFTSNRDGNYEIYVMNDDGTKLRRATHNEDRDDFACWHRDGKHLAYVGQRNGRFDIYQTVVPD